MSTRSRLPSSASSPLPSQFFWETTAWPSWIMYIESASSPSRMIASLASRTISSTTSATREIMRPERVPKILTDCRKVNLALRSAIALSRKMCWNIVRCSSHICASVLARMVAVRSRSYTSATSPKTVSLVIVSTSLSPPTTTASEPVSTQYARSPVSPSLITSTPALTSTGAMAATSCSRSDVSCPSKGGFFESVSRMRRVSSSDLACTCTT